MSDQVKPATDEEIAALPTDLVCIDCGCRNPDVCNLFTPRLLARIDAEKALNAEMMAALKDAHENAILSEPLWATIDEIIAKATQK